MCGCVLVDNWHVPNGQVTRGWQSVQSVLCTAWVCQTLLQENNGHSQPVIVALKRLTTGAQRMQ